MGFVAAVLVLAVQPAASEIRPSDTNLDGKFHSLDLDFLGQHVNGGLEFGCASPLAADVVPNREPR